MSKILDERDVVELIQKSLQEKSFAVAYFTRDREYVYYTFEDINDIIELMKSRHADSASIDKNKSYKLDFSIDEWFIFDSCERASGVLSKLPKEIIYED